MGLGLLLRLFLASFPGFGTDIGDYHAWSIKLANDGAWNFYGSGYFADNPPGYMYVLWLIGWLSKAFELETGQILYILKLPAIAFDLASAYVLYLMLSEQRPVFRLGAPALYLLLPAVLLLGPIWGQSDSALALSLLLTVYLFSRGRLAWGAVAYTVGFLIKPQAIAILPLVAFWILRSHPLVRDLGGQLMSAKSALTIRPAALPAFLVALPSVLFAPLLPAYRDHPERKAMKEVALAIWGAVAAGLLIVIPFFPEKPWEIVNQLLNAQKVYPYNTFWAYNFWALFGLFKPDNLEFIGISYRAWGFFLFGVSTVAILVVFRKSESPGLMALAASLSVLALYLFLTRMHERYFFAFFLPFLAACVLLNHRVLWASFAGLSAIHFLNLYHVYGYYNENELRWQPLMRMLQDTSILVRGVGFPIFIMSLLIFLSFPLLLATAGVLMRRKGASKSP